MANRVSAALCGLLLTAAAASGAGAQVLGDADEGQRFAREVCVACHAVERGDKIMSLVGAPPFQLVAADPAASEISLRVFLRSPHETMPDLVLSDEEMDDVIAYILSLR